VLVVDDDPAVREMIVEYLATRGYQVQASPEGRLALALLTHSRFDVVLTDLRLPQVEGASLLEAARQRQPPVPCVVMTGLATTESVVRAFKAGAFDYLVKPFRLQVLHDTLQDAIDRSRKMRKDALLESLVALYDFAATVRDRASLRILAQQVASLALDMAPGLDVRVLLESAKGGWDILAPPADPRRKEVQGMLADLDVPALVAALEPGETLFCEEPSRFLPGTEDHDVESGVGWVAARPVVADGPSRTAPLAGAVVVAGDPAEVVPTDAVLQPLVRFALVLGQAVVRHHCMTSGREP
jgi:CheY-like chemotaxis protein